MEKKKMSLYKKSLLIFAISLVALGSLFLIYVYKSLVTYEENLIENYMDTLLKSGTLADSYKGNFKVSEYEDVKDIKDALNDLYESDSVKWKEVKNDNKDIYSYQITVDGTVITTVDLSIESVSNKLGLLKVNNWKLEGIEYKLDDGIYSYEFNIPEDYTVYINDKKVSVDGEVKKDSYYQRLSEYTKVASNKTFKITGLIKEPKIKIEDSNNKEVEFKKENNKVTVESNFKEVELKELKLKDNFDVLKFAENWSLFLTNDLSGGMRGFNTLLPNLIEGSYMYTMAREWATGIDITFVSNHRLLNPVFTDEGVSKCIQYNDEAFSCEVKLKKHLRLVKTGEEKEDSMHERVFFVYKDGNYKLVDMKSIKE